MTSLLTINHYVNQANTFIADVRDKSGAYYVFVGRPNPWTNANGDVDDTQVQVVNNSVTQIELDTFNDLLYGKLVGSSDVSHATRRINWVAGTVYDEYDASDEDLYDKNFFVITSGAGDQYNVYKCLYNNNGAPSTIKPTMQSTVGTFTTGDGYVWKFMYTVDATANSKFTTSNFIPVTPNSAVQAAAVPGTIDVIKVLDGGSGYNVFETGEVQTVVDRNTIKIAANSSTANDYYSGSSIYLKSGFGSGQVRQITDYDGSSKNLVISTPIDLFIKLDVSNTANIVTGGANVGQIASQTYDDIQYTYRAGYFNAGANVIQTDTGVAGRVLSANASNIVVSKFDKTFTFSNSYAFRDVADTGTRMTDKVTVTTTGALSNTAKLMVQRGSGYNGHAAITIVANGSGSGATANAINTINGRIEVRVATTGSGYIYEPTVTIAPPVAQTFNANAIVSNAIAISTANRFVANDLVTYSRLTGGANVGISNGSYYISFANTTHIALATTVGGANIALTNTASADTNHSIQGQTAVARLYPDTLYAVNAAAGAVFTTDYAVNNFIRVGENANVNIRRVTSVNSTMIVVNLPFTVSVTSANTFKMNTAAEPASNVVVTTANAVITNTNLTSVKLVFTNSSPSGESFIVGESVDYVSSSNVALGANGIVAYTNSSVMYISSVSGVWSSGNRVRGAASQVIADVVNISSNPNVIVTNPNGVFVIGYPVDFTTTTGTAQGSATLVDASSLTSGVIEYEIGPTVTISGDGTGAIAVARVDVSNNSSNSVNEILVVNTGSYYTQANIAITSNTSYGSGANAYALISPLLGHGADPAAELGARYVALDVKFQNAQTEEWKFPTSVSFRKVGIMKDPLFANVEVTVQSFDRASLALANTVGSWSNGEVVIQTQASANATGIVLSGNATSLHVKQVKGTFNTSNGVVGLTSGTTANVSSASVVVFSSNNVLTQDTTGATAVVASTEGNTVLHLANVQGQLTSNLVVYAGNAYATVNAITRPDGSDETSNFGLRFNQTSRVTLTSNVGSQFVPYEFVTQGSASGRVIATTSDLDLQVANGTNFASSDTITNSNTAATAKATFANSTYIKLTGVSNVAAFAVGHTINNGSTSTTISNLYSVIVLSDITKGSNFTANTTQLVGSSANSLVKIASQPDIIRESGKVIYTEASNTVVTRSLNSTEEVRLIVKF